MIPPRRRCVLPYQTSRFHSVCGALCVLARCMVLHGIQHEEMSAISQCFPSTEKLCTKSHSGVFELKKNYAEIASWSPDTIAGKFYLRSQLPVARYPVRDDMNIGLYVFASAQGSTSSLQLVFPPFWTLRYSAPAPIPSFQTIPFVFWTTSCDPQGLFGGLSRQLAQCDPLLWTHAS